MFEPRVGQVRVVALKNMNKIFCYINGIVSPTAHVRWLFCGHMTCHNETVSSQKRLTSNTAKSMTSEGNSTLLPANTD